MSVIKINRRDFLKSSSFGAMIVGLHPEYLFSNELTAGHNKGSLIKHISLQTNTSLFEMKYFYHQQLGLELVSSTSEDITFKAGHSLITFQKSENNESDPWYHFAFNIPENKLLKAREWQIKRTDLIPTPENKRDTNYPNDIRYFRKWNAHSLFFWDPAGNLLEYIARHDLSNGKDGDFVPEDILNVSEIGLVVDDQEDLAKKINDRIGLKEYPRGSSYWWAMGDENGLILCIPKRIWGENTDKPKRFSVYKTEVKISGKKINDLSLDNFPYNIEVIDG